MTIYTFEDLLAHVGHTLHVITYDHYNIPTNVLIECEECGEVLLEFENDKYLAS